MRDVPSEIKSPEAPARSAAEADPRGPSGAEPRVHGEAIWYRLLDVGYEIHLDRAFDLLAASAPERPRPTRGEAQAIQIANPPVAVNLGSSTVILGGVAHEAELSARLFDFGVISLRARLAAPSACSWSQYVAFGAAAGAASAWTPALERARGQLLPRMMAAIEHMEESRVTEDYVVFRVHRMEDTAGRRLTAEALTDSDVARLLIGEPRPLAEAARHELLSQRFSYFEDDLAVLTWNAALVVEPTVEDTDVQYVLEFANAQLLELRLYDAVLDAELPRIYHAIAQARRGFHLAGRRYSRVLASLQSRVTDANELVERVENSLKVTDDVFLARIYSAALEIFRGRTWRSGIDRKVAIVRDTYGMLNAESQARRTEILEVVVILLILIEVVLALVRS
jgi:hypothetical protein